ncbi:hypothetical protein Dimus_035356 [Dionaea muscipula]
MATGRRARCRAQEADCRRAPLSTRSSDGGLVLWEDDDADVRDRLNGDGDEAHGGKTVKMMMEEERKWSMTV